MACNGPNMTQDQLTGLLNLSSPAIGIAFIDKPPAGIERVSHSGPASCDYWRQAAEGHTFYTIADDHKACPIGAHTHHVLRCLVRGNARQLMLVTEAAQLAGVAGVSPAMGRPTCAVLPASINSKSIEASFGCVGNRVYTGATENEAYIAIPGQHLSTIVESLRTIINAKNALEQFHRERASR